MHDKFTVEDAEVAQLVKKVVADWRRDVGEFLLLTLSGGFLGNCPTDSHNFSSHPLSHFPQKPQLNVAVPVGAQHCELLCLVV
jgi:hypothetical protein